MHTTACTACIGSGSGGLLGNTTRMIVQRLQEQAPELGQGTHKQYPVLVVFYLCAIRETAPRKPLTATESASDRGCSALTSGQLLQTALLFYRCTAVFCILVRSKQLSAGLMRLQASTCSYRLTQLIQL